MTIGVVYEEAIVRRRILDPVGYSGRGVVSQEMAGVSPNQFESRFFRPFNDLQDIFRQDHSVFHQFPNVLGLSLIHI